MSRILLAPSSPLPHGTGGIQHAPTVARPFLVAALLSPAMPRKGRTFFGPTFRLALEVSGRDEMFGPPNPTHLAYIANVGCESRLTPARFYNLCTPRTCASPSIIIL